MQRLSLVPRFAIAASLIAALPILAACLDHPLKPVELEKEQEKEDNIQLTINKDVDVLFVIDNSGSMGEEQGVLAQNFGAFISVLEDPMVEANYRLGVTTTDNGNPICGGTTPEAGKMRASSCRSRLSEFTFTGTNPPTVKEDEACLAICPDKPFSILETTTAKDSTSKARPWLQNINGETNIPADWTTTEAFRCIGPQGINGCGFESHLESMYKALKRTSVESEDQFGFLRDSALLSVIIVTDEADCSYVTDYGDIFLPEGDRAFWSDPDANFPTSAVCWNAGVACTGDPSSYTECHSENFDSMGNPGVGDGQAVLHPVQRYVDELNDFEDQKREFNPDAEVLVGVIAGVGSDGSATYQGTGDQAFIDDYGAAPGCTSAVATAVPPVRLKEFADQLAVSGDQNLFSVCENDYSVALRAIAETIGRQLKPPCMPACVADTEPEQTGVQPQCTLVEEILGDAASVPECKADLTPPDGKTVCFYYKTDKDGSIPGMENDMDTTCVDEGWNLEFGIVRTAPAAAGAKVKATCILSDTRQLDCPDLG